MWSFLILFFLLSPARGTRVDWNDKELVEIRKDILDWWKKSGPTPVQRCGKEGHNQAMEKTKELDDVQGRKLLAMLQNLMMASSNKPFVGINETVQALRTKRAEVLLIGKETKISVYDFRNPLTGNHIYEFCEGFNCDQRKDFSDGSDYGTYFLSSCLPFPDFVRKFYKRKGPQLITTSVSSPFFKSVSSIAGIFKDDVLFYNLPVRSVPEKGKFRSHFWTHKLEVKTNQ